MSSSRSPSFSLLTRIACVSLVAGWMAACGDDSDPDAGNGGAGRGGGGGGASAGRPSAGSAGVETGGTAPGAGGAGGGDSQESLGGGGASDSNSAGSGGQDDSGDAGAPSDAGAGGQPSEQGTGGRAGAPSGTAGSAGTAGAGSPPRLPCDVAAILRNSCYECHSESPSNGAPFSLVTYSQVQITALQIKAVLLEDSMPPEGPLSQADKTTLFDWIDSGAPSSTAVCP